MRTGLRRSGAPVRRRREAPSGTSGCLAQQNHPVLNETPTTTNRTEMTVTGIICHASEVRFSSDSRGMILKRPSAAQAIVSARRTSLVPQGAIPDCRMQAIKPLRYIRNDSRGRPEVCGDLNEQGGHANHRLGMPGSPRRDYGRGSSVRMDRSSMSLAICPCAKRWSSWKAWYVGAGYVA